MRNDRLTELELHVAVARNACGEGATAAAAAIKTLTNITESDALVLLCAIHTRVSLADNARFNPLIDGLQTVVSRLGASIDEHAAAQARAAAKAQQEWNSLAVREQGGLAQFERAFAPTEFAK